MPSLFRKALFKNNPCEGIPNLYSNDRSDIIWSNADLDAICAAASPVVALAARLAALTGLRRGDLLRLSWSHVGDTSIEIRTSKSGGKRLAVIPITTLLGELLNEIPKRATTVLTNTQGRPWSKSGFESAWRRAKERANLTQRQLHFHDLRGTAATNLYKAKLSSREIADILGWSEERVERLIDRYVKRDELMRERIRKNG